MSTAELTQYAQIALPVLTFVAGSYITYLMMRTSKSAAKKKAAEPKWLKEIKSAAKDYATYKVILTINTVGRKEVKVQKYYE